MLRQASRSAVYALVFIGIIGTACVSDARAGAILDWLCGREPEPAQSTVACYPPSCYDPCDPCNTCNPCVTYPVQAAPCTPVAAPTQAAPMTVQPTPIYTQPTPTYTQPMGNYGTAPIVTPASQAYVPPKPRVNPIPQTYYKTSWTRVPVTSYRPVVSTDPVTGYPLTVMKPCVTYEWRPIREREGLLRRLFRPLFGPRTPAPTATVCAPTPVCGAPAVCTPTCTPTCTPAPCGPTTMIQPSPTAGIGSPTPAAAAPYYGGAPTPSPSPAPPIVPAPGAATLAPPPNVAPRRGATGGNTPADRAPSLKPADNGTTAKPYTSRKPTPMTELNSAQPGPDTKKSPSSSAPPAGKLHLRPIPDPDAQRQQPSGLNAPQLLKPSDRVASLISYERGARVPISWPSQSKRAPRVINRHPRPAQHVQPQPTTWDDSGWHSVGQ